MDFSNGLLGLGGFGGMNAQSPGLLSKYYDPEMARKMQMKQGLLGAGIALLSQQPRVGAPYGFGESLGTALRGGVEGAQNAQQDYMNNAMMAYEMDRKAQDDAWQEKSRTRQEHAWDDEDQKKKAHEAFISALPEDQRALAAAYPQQFGDMYTKMQMKMAFPDDSSAEYGLNPIVVQNPETGEYQLLQPSKDGSAPRVVQFPNGFQYAPPTRTLDTGTGYETVPTKGTPSPIGSPIPKDIVGEKTQQEIGKGQGEAAVMYKSVQSKMPGLERVVSDLDTLADKATYTLFGQALNETRKQLGMEPSEGAVARTQYQVTVANQILPLLRDTFGAQFTQAEGERLLATLGDPDTTPTEKQAALKAFIEQKRRDVEALAAQAGMTVAPAPSPIGNDPLGLR